nr:serine/arginine repetitive matrix protein 1-like [Aegilops tauschii subsp. strangulata]
MAPAAARCEATNGSPPNHRPEVRSQPAPAAKSTHRKSHPASLAAVQGPEQGSPDWRTASAHHQHACPPRARPPCCTQQRKHAPPPARRRAQPAPAVPPDLAEPRPGRHCSHKREPPRVAHRAATKPSLPRRQGPPPRPALARSTAVRRRPASTASERDEEEPRRHQRRRALPGSVIL